MAPISKIQKTPPPYLSTVPEGAGVSQAQHEALRELECACYVTEPEKPSSPLTLWAPSCDAGAFDVSTERLGQIVQRFLAEFQAGLSDDQTPLLPMIPTYIHVSRAPSRKAHPCSTRLTRACMLRTYQTDPRRASFWPWTLAGPICGFAKSPSMAIGPSRCTHKNTACRNNSRP